MTMPTGLLEWGQAGQFNAIDDRSAIAALWASAGGLPGLVSPPTLTAGSGLAITMGPWLAIVDCGDGTKAVIGNRASATFNETAGGASARVDVLWADINPDNATWTLSLITEAQMTGRSGCFLGLIFVGASVSTSAAMTLNPGNSRRIGAWGGAQLYNQTVSGSGVGNLATMTIPAYDADVGATYELELWGNGTITSGNKTTLTFWPAIGANSYVSAALGSTAFGNSNLFRWWAKARIIVVSTGTGGQVRSFIKANQSEWNTTVSPSNGNFAEVFAAEAAGTNAMDCTRAQTFAVKAQWGATGQSLTCQVGIPKRVA